MKRTVLTKVTALACAACAVLPVVAVPVDRGTGCAGADVPRVVVDTDLGSSVDELFAFEILARLHRNGKVRLAGVMQNRPDRCDIEGKGEFLRFTDAYLTLLGIGDIPIGRARSLPSGTPHPIVINPYWTLVNEKDANGAPLLPASGRDLAALPDAVTLYRRILCAAPDKSVVICSIGFFDNLRGLLESSPDVLSPLPGRNLVAKKAREVRIMAGCFDGSVEHDRGGLGEYNVQGAVAAAKAIFEYLTETPLVCSPWEAGMKLALTPEQVLSYYPEGCANRVIRETFRRWPNPPKGFYNRLWDLLVILPLSEGDALAPLSEPGWITVDDSELIMQGGVSVPRGLTRFRAAADGRHRYQVAEKMDSSRVMARVRALLTDRKGNER